jgi:hypothetical protein
MLARLTQSLYRALGRVASTTPIEIIPKDDARAVFAMTREQWNENVRQAVMAGICRTSGRPEIGLSMSMLTQEGHLVLVQPNYATDPERPDFVQVDVGYRDPVPGHLTDAMLKDAIKAAEKQMQPEYELIGGIDRFAGGMSVYFFIREKR